MSAVVLDTHVLVWWSSEPERLSPTATAAVIGASELLVSAITWFELSWLARHDRIVLAVPVPTWLDGLAAGVQTVGITPSIADVAVALPASFPIDLADRLIYATALVRGTTLVTKDRRLRKARQPRQVTVW